MKIAILSPFYPYRGGIAQFSGMLYRALEHEHEVAAFSFSHLYPSFLFPGKTQFVTDDDDMLPIPAQAVLDSTSPLSYASTARAIARFEPDLLIVAYWMSFFAPAYAAVSRRLKKKTRIVALLHNAIPHEPSVFDRPLARMFFKQCHSFVVMSEIVKNDLLRLRPNARCVLLHHPIYNQFGKKLPVEKAQRQWQLLENKKTLLFFGLIRDYKGLDLLLEAVGRLDDSYQLLVAGEVYGSFDKYQAIIDASPAKERIKVFNHYMETSEVPSLFSAADAVVLPYKSATQSGVIPVAYHFETPVVTTDVGGLKETIEHAQTGIVCQPKAEALAEGIKQLFAVGKDTFVQHIREEKKKLTWENFAAALVAQA